MESENKVQNVFFVLCTIYVYSPKTLYSVIRIRSTHNSRIDFYNSWLMRTRSNRGFFRTIWRVFRFGSRVQRYYISNVANVTRILRRDKPVSSHPFRTSRYLNTQDNRPFLGTKKRENHTFLFVRHGSFWFVEIPVPTK